jgi:hypothetical protein
MKTTRELDDRVGFFLTDNGGMFIAGMVYLGHTNVQPSAFSPFDSITPLAIAVPPTNGTALSVAEAVRAPGPEGVKYITAGLSIRTDSSLYQAVNDIYQEMLARQNVSASFSLSFTSQPVTANASIAFNKFGGNSLGIEGVGQSCKLPFRISIPQTHHLTL